ncbi:hypothetical protein HG15A2_24960 [Adhaeretor mobilis]|uniref:PpiC domain-containing protein n=2 Tax=Adhaeretor mobilis TaxID=1930276 RepID=A0A517MWE9_9BACT|nr:hypothetical protein HG15A2_24960 [Adhaeretor mobilis]
MDRTFTSRMCVIAVLAACGLPIFPCTVAKAVEDVVATVNGHDITLPEFRRSLLDHRAAVFDYFSRQYGADEVQGKFWTSSFDGEVPLKKLRKLALDSSVRIKLQQQLALEKGLVRDISYAAFLRRLAEENRNRKRAVENHEPIYGPVEYSESTGYTHNFSLLVVRLKQSLADDDCEITVAELRDFYEANKEQFKRPDPVTFRGLRASDTDAKEILRQLASQLREGGEIKDSMQSKRAGLVYFEQTIRDTARRGELSGSVDFSPEVRELPMGAIKLFDQASELFLIQVVARRDMGYYLFNDKLKRVLQRRYIDHAYESSIAQRVNEAEVVVDELVYGRVMAH